MTPSSWLIANAALLPRSGLALDVACGEGRHALWLASRGLTTLALDRDAAKIAALAGAAGSLGLPLTAETRDLETGSAGLGSGKYDAIVVASYLHRPLFPALREALAPGGVLVYETFTTAQALRGHPRNPAFLLAPGELRTLVAPLEVLAEREGEFEGRDVASVVARKQR